MYNPTSCFAFRLVMRTSLFKVLLSLFKTPIDKSKDETGLIVKCKNLWFVNDC